jgi:cell division protein FtsB
MSTTTPPRPPGPPGRSTSPPPSRSSGRSTTRSSGGSSTRSEGSSSTRSQGPSSGRSSAPSSGRSSAPSSGGAARGGAAAPALDAAAERAARRPELRLVRPPRRIRTGLLGSLVVSIVFVTLFVLAAMQAVLVQGQLRLDQLQSDLSQREQDRDRLDLEVNTLESPDRLAGAAQALGMVPAPQVLFLYADPAAGSAKDAPQGPVAVPDTLAASAPGATATPGATASPGATVSGANGSVRAGLAVVSPFPVAQG